MKKTCEDTGCGLCFDVLSRSEGKRAHRGQPLYAMYALVTHVLRVLLECYQVQFK